jgi:hypothetical protein
MRTFAILITTQLNSYGRRIRCPHMPVHRHGVYNFLAESSEAGIEDGQRKLSHQVRIQISRLGGSSHYRFDNLTCVNVLPRTLYRDYIGVG